MDVVLHNIVFAVLRPRLTFNFRKGVDVGLGLPQVMQARNQSLVLICDSLFHLSVGSVHLIANGENSRAVSLFNNSQRLVRFALNLYLLRHFQILVAHEWFLCLKVFERGRRVSQTQYGCEDEDEEQ